ncbi:MAG: TraM recognition domain-containing protein [Trichlorobacter sp.]|nr:TraM recognition domain-containing protein [Trichlorobacter sp.]
MSTKEAMAPETLFGRGVHMDTPSKIQDIIVPDNDRKRGTIIFGTTGVGKTRLAENIIEQDIKKGMSVIYFDPKGDQEIFSKVVNVADKAGRLSEVMLVTPIYPEYSAMVDPLSHYYMPDEIVGHIVSGIETGKEPFFRNVAKEITTAVVLALILLNKKDKRAERLNIDKIRRSITVNEIKKLIDGLRSEGTPEAERIAGMLEQIHDSGQDYYNKVSSSLRVALTDLSFGNVGKIIGTADSNRFIDRLEKSKGVIMVVHTGSLLTRDAAQTLGKVLLSMVQSFVGRVYMSKKQAVKGGLSVHIDEAQSLLYHGFEEIPAKAGSANVMLTLYAQSVNQIFDAVGDLKGRSILDNINTKLFLRCADVETSKYVSEHFGTKKRLTGIYGNSTITTRETEEEALKVTDILDLEPREFYMMTYKGRYKGKSITSSPVDVRITFPEAPTWQ